MSREWKNRVVVSADDLATIPDEKLRLVARAAIAAGYKTEVREVRYQEMIFANGIHFFPLTSWEQCVRLIVDTGSYFELGGGAVFVSNPDGTKSEKRAPNTDDEYRRQMCEAVVTNVAKGFA